MRAALSGLVFGRLIVTKFVPGATGVRAKWECVCECGAVVRVVASKLKTGHTRSCGCLLIDWIRSAKTTHGHALKTGRSLTYKSWSNMKTRCGNPKAVNFARYGGAGVTICRRWLDSFEAFLADMGERPSQRHSIERVDNAKGYEPGNCIWATISQQSVNKKISLTVIVNGTPVPLSEACHRYGVKYGTAWMRLHEGREWNA